MAINNENFFVVPGNHDVNRSEVPSATTSWLDSLSREHDGVTRVTEMLQERNKDWRTCMERLEEYGLFLAVGGYNHLLEDQERLIYGAVRDIRGVKVGIAGLNSAWSCSRDNEKSKLWLGGHWQIQTLQQKIADTTVKIGLIHHPPNWFGEKEDPSVTLEFERAFNFLLHGHEHQNWVSHPNERHVRIAAGACYGSSVEESGYSFVRLNLDEGTGEIWLRCYDKVGRGWIPRVIHGRTDDRGVWPLNNLPWKLSPPVTAPLPIAIKSNDQPPFADSSPESRGVFGRHADIKKLVQMMTQQPIIIVYGLSGVGKSLLVQEIRYTKTYQASGYVRFTTYPDLRLDDLYRHLAPALGCAEEDPTPPMRLLGHLEFSALRRFAPNARPCIIHLDRAHHLFDGRGFHNDDIREFLLTIVRFAPQMRIIMKSREEPPQDLLPTDVHKKLRVVGLDRESMVSFFQHPFRYDSTKGWSLADDEIELVYRRLGGDGRQGRVLPLGMSLLAQVADGLQETPAQAVKRHERIVQDRLEEELFKDLYNRVLDEPERKVLRLCALYRDYIPDLHVDRLDEAAGRKGAFDHLARRCLLNSDEAQDSYSLHSIIADLTQRQIDPTGDEFFEDHECIANAWLSRLTLSQRSSLPNILAASEAVYHLTAAQRFDRLDELPRRLLRQGDVTSHLENISLQLHQSGRYDEDQRVLERVPI